MGAYLRPRTLEEALAVLARPAGGGPRSIVAGATDVLPVAAARDAWLQPRPRAMLDIGGIAGLSGLHETADEVVIGATTSWSAVLAADLPPGFDALKQAAAQVGGVQIQNRGTLGGNLCNASPAADGVPPLLALGASVELASAAGRRVLPLADFVLGNRRTALAPDELLLAIRVPRRPERERSVFLKLGARAYLVISIASVAANIVPGGDGRIAGAAIAVGACSAVPQRLTVLERDLVGVTWAEAAALPMPHHLAMLSPIDDVRASAAYRQQAALVLVRRALLALAGNAALEQAA
jgi:N-methylhydantoinase B